MTMSLTLLFHMFLKLLPHSLQAFGHGAVRLIAERLRNFLSCAGVYFCHRRQGYFRQNRVFHNTPEAYPASFCRMAWRVLRGDYVFMN